MTKAELYEAVAERAEVKKTDVARVLDAYQDVVVETLKKGNKVTVPGFGTFETRKREARTGINPKTMESIKIPAKTVPAFKVGKRFKDEFK